MIRFVLFLVFLPLMSCSVGSLSDRPYSAFLSGFDPILSVHISEAKPAARQKIAEAFRSYDASLEALGGSVDREQWHQFTSKSLRIVYEQYVNGSQNVYLNGLGQRLTSQVKQAVLKEGPGFNVEKHLMFEVEKASQAQFDEVFDRCFHNPRAKVLFKQFVNQYTQGFFVLNAEDPEYVEEFLMMDVAIFRLSLYLLFTDGLPGLR